jgi:hypothetical protein
MKNTHPFFLLAALFFFNLSIAQDTTKTITTYTNALTPQTKFTYGIQVNSFAFQRLPSYVGGGNKKIGFGTDYSVYLRYKNFGVLGGYSALYNFNNGITDTKGGISCFNAGIIYKFFQFSKTGAITLYLYNIHYSEANKNYKPAGLYNGIYQPITYTGETINFIIANPRYTGTFYNGILSLEFGVFFSVFKDNIHNSTTDDSSYPAIGINAGATLNVSALFTKK